MPSMQGNVRNSVEATTPQTQKAATMPDTYDEQAAIAGEAAGLRPEQWPGLAHILRQTAAAEREACASDLDSLADMATMMGDESAWRALRSAADAIRNRSN